MMRRELLESRLAELRGDFAEGEKALRDIDSRREQLHISLLRVGGAIQVIEELLATDAADAAGAGGAAGAAAPVPVHSAARA